MNETEMQRGQQWLEELLKLAKVPSTVETQQQQDCCWLTINETNLTREQVEIIIGPNGTVLDAIQYLCNTVLNIDRDREEPIAYTVELDGYRIRRENELRAMAQEAADYVREMGGEFEIRALSSAERRQVHNFLSESEDLETYSRGQEPDRRLVVRQR
jgi:spoIIIJ-associated protein